MWNHFKVINGSDHLDVSLWEIDWLNNVETWKN